MVILSYLLAGAYLLLIPFVIGQAADKLSKGRLNKRIGNPYPAACILLSGYFEIAFLAALRLGLNLKQLSLGYGISVLVLALVSIPFALKAEKPAMPKGKVLFPAAVCFALIMVSLLFQRTVATTYLYSGAETVTTLAGQAANGPLSAVAGIDPLTGREGAGQLCKGIYAFYASLCLMSGAGPSGLLKFVINPWILFLGFVMVRKAALTFSEKAADGACLCFGLATLCANTAYRNPFYDLVHLAYEGRAFMAFLILPFIFVVIRPSAKASQYAFEILCLLLMLPAAILSCGTLMGGLLLLGAAFLWRVGLWISSCIS
ncbi:MAG: hypothetical protein K6E84_10200 [Lachnospiraceae bacterium]|nr:hypothetical protein [Lachnospiraceae bacterium]